MKKTVLTLSLIGALTVITAKNTGVATNFGQDRTGSPVGLSPQCSACHSGGTVTPTITLRMLDSAGIAVTSYTPGETYTYEVELSTGGSQQFGFQTVGLFASGNANAGTLTALSSNAKIVTLNGRKYGEQITKTSNGLFQMQWVAPTNGGGEVRFYAAGVAVNSNASTSGDKAVTSAPLILSENVFFSVNETEKTTLQIYPNPVAEILNINTNVSGEFNLNLYNLEGKLVFSQQVIAYVGKNMEVPVLQLTAGTYIASLTRPDGKTIATEKLIKK